MAKNMALSVRNIKAIKEVAKHYIQGIKARERRAQEAYPATGHAEDIGWRPITQNKVNRDLNPVTQDKMQNIAVWLYDSDPMAKRIIDLKRDFLVGDGVTAKAEDEAVDEIIQSFWNDPINNMDAFVPDIARDLGLFGEQAIPTFVNKQNGHVRLGYLDPCLISKVIVNPSNCRELVGLVLKDFPGYMDELDSDERALLTSWRAGQGLPAPGKSDETKTSYTIISVNQNVQDKKNYDRLTGDVFFFAINKVTNATRGRSDLLVLADWIHNYESFLFNRIERARLLNCFLWDVTLTGMQPKQIDEWLAKQAVPRASSIRAHNEKVKWETVSPSLESNDASNEAMLFRSHIAGGAGIPVYWLGGGEGLTRATALEMGTSTYKNLKQRQLLLKGVVSSMLNYVIDQAIIAKRLKPNVNCKFKVTFPPLSQKDLVTLSTALGAIADALTMAVSSKFITAEEASVHMRMALNLLGGDLAPEALAGVVPGGEAADPGEGVGQPKIDGVNAGMKEAIHAHRRVCARGRK